MSVRISLLVLPLVACVPTTPPLASPANVYVSSEAHASIDTSDMGPVPCADCASMPARERSIQVFADRRVPRPTEVLGVLDFHSDATSEDKGFNELRSRAAAMGGDAVIGAEFEHGEGNEPSHLSGVVVRFVNE